MKGINRQLNNKQAYLGLQLILIYYSQYAKLTNLSNKWASIVSLQWKELSDDDLIQLSNVNTDHMFTLSLSNNNITSLGIKNLVTPSWENLVSLSLNCNKITSIGCKYLTRASLKNLKSLFLGENEIGNEGARHLSKGRWQLQFLQLFEVQLSIGGFPWLIKGNWSKMKHLNLPCNDLTYFELLKLLLSEFKQSKSIQANKNIRKISRKDIQTIINNGIQKFPNTTIFL